MFIILIGMMILLVYTYIKIHETGLHVHFTVFQFYFEKAVKKLGRGRHRWDQPNPGYGLSLEVSPENHTVVLFLVSM